jgi:hypothetical protein
MAKTRKRTHTAQLDEADALEVEAWIWQRRRERLTISQVVELMAKPIAEGGLDKVMSRSTLWRRVERTRADKLALMGKDIAAERLEAIEELDEISQGLRELAGKWYFDANGDRQARPESMRYSALVAMADVALKRAKLSGLESPVQIEATVVHASAIDIELDKLIAQANKTPKVES